MVGCADGAGTQDDLLPVYRKHLPAAYHEQSHGTVAVEDDAVDQAIGPDGQVEPVADGVQVTHGRAYADFVNDVERQGPDARGVGAVVVGAVGEAHVSGGPVEGALVGRPLLLGVAATGDRAIITVELVPEVLVGLHAFHIGQHFFEGPLIVAPFGPSVVVFPLSAKELGAVNCAGASGDLAARDVHTSPGCGSGAEVPEVVRIENRSAAVCKFDLLGEAFDFGEISASFEEEDGAVWIFGESGGKGGSRGACPHDDVVVFHAV